jgi:hypothetical protein
MEPAAAIKKGKKKAHIPVTTGRPWRWSAYFPAVGDP